tara:strand:+ start:10309 stop:11223 length:915 start_codon:yes stop_codon:yes gene_type:complete
MTTRKLIIGDPASGKTTLIRRELDIARAENAVCLVVDAEGDLFKDGYKDGDLVLDLTCSGDLEWSILAELKDNSDADLLLSLFERTCPDDSYVNYLRPVYKAILGHMWHGRQLGDDIRNRDLIKFALTVSDNKHLSLVYADFGNFCDAHPEAGFDSFSIRDWLLNSVKAANPSVLWIKSGLSERKSVNFMCNLFSALSFSALSEQEAERAWFFCDNLAMTGELSALPHYFSESKCNFVASGQSVPALKRQYAKEYDNDNSAWEIMESHITNKVLLVPLIISTPAELKKYDGWEHVARLDKYQNR